MRLTKQRMATEMIWRFVRRDWGWWISTELSDVELLERGSFPSSLTWELDNELDPLESSTNWSGLLLLLRRLPSFSSCCSDMFALIPEESILLMRCSSTRMSWAKFAEGFQTHYLLNDQVLWTDARACERDNCHFLTGAAQADGNRYNPGCLRGRRLGAAHIVRCNDAPIKTKPRRSSKFPLRPRCAIY